MKQVLKSLTFISLFGFSLTFITYFALAATPLVKGPQNISSSGTDAVFPAAATSDNGDYVGLVWVDRYSGGRADGGPIYFRGTTKSGEKDGIITHTLTVKNFVDNSDSVSDQSATPDIANDPVTPSNMHVVWANLQGTTIQEGRIYYTTCSATSGSCVEETPEQVALVNLTTNNDEVNTPKIVTAQLNSGTTHVFTLWQYVNGDAVEANNKSMIRFNHKSVGGTWVGETTLSTDSARVFASNPSLAYSSSGGVGYLHAVWAVDTNGDEVNDAIQYRRGTVDLNSGNVTWGGIQTFTGNSKVGVAGTDPDYPTIAAANANVMLMWDERTSTPPQANEQFYAFYCASTDSGGSFGECQHVDFSNQMHRSDANTSSSTADVGGADHAQRLQMNVTAHVPSSSPSDVVFSVVWHETVTSGGDAIPRHEVVYGEYTASTSCSGGGGGELVVADCNKWDATFLKPTENNKTVTTYAYSMVPEMVVNPSGNRFLFYAESKEDGEYKLYDETVDSALSVVDIIYQGDAVLVDNTPTIYLPLVLKNAQ